MTGIKSLAEAWESFSTEVAVIDDDEELRQWIRGTFIAAATATFFLVAEAAHADGPDKMVALGDEIKNFGAEMDALLEQIKARVDKPAAAKEAAPAAPVKLLPEDVTIMDKLSEQLTGVLRKTLDECGKSATGATQTLGGMLLALLWLFHTMPDRDSRPASLVILEGMTVRTLHELIEFLGRMKKSGGKEPQP